MKCFLQRCPNKIKYWTDFQIDYELTCSNGVHRFSQTIYYQCNKELPSFKRLYFTFSKIFLQMKTIFWFTAFSRCPWRWLAEFWRRFFEVTIAGAFKPSVLDGKERKPVILRNTSVLANQTLTSFRNSLNSTVLY